MKIRILVCLALLIVVSSPVYAFASDLKNPVIEKANDAFDNGNYKLAIELYEKVIASEPGNLNVLFWAAGAAQAIEDYELKGKFAKRYYFYGQHKRDKSPFVVSLGSYPWINELERELGDLSVDQRIYHLDGYDGNFHYTFAFYKTEPDMTR